MPILNPLISLYERRGIHIATGFSPWRYANLPKVAFTWFLRGGACLTNGLGISSQEVYFLECLFEGFRPSRIFVIGNSWGWSTLAVALLNPQARVVAIDSGFDDNALEGLAFTNQVAEEERLNLKVVKATSPGDVPGVLTAEFDGPVDFAFIDGYHTKEQVYLDFAAIRPLATADAVYLFHDVLEFGLEPGVARAAAVIGQPWHVLDGTSSGMAILLDGERRPEVMRAIAPFRASDAAKSLLAHEVYKSTHRRRLKWRRSIDKRVRRVRQALGWA
jgi:predicted O-methyltransferase YrrM